VYDSARSPNGLRVISASWRRTISRPSSPSWESLQTLDVTTGRASTACSHRVSNRRLPAARSASTRGVVAGTRRVSRGVGGNRAIVIDSTETLRARAASSTMGCRPPEVSPRLNYYPPPDITWW
jgi:hypothetical protein